jgi:hypothetical protein
MSSRYGTLEDINGNKIYPNPYYKIGDIFITTRDENPSERFGGTWEKLPDETFLMTSSENYPIKSIGGENEHTLTVDEIPNHTHTIYSAGNTNYATGVVTSMGNRNGNNPTTNTISTSNCGDKPHNNMPKFYAVYVWIRVA